METSEEAGNLPMKKLSLANRMDNPFYTEPTTKDPDRSLSSIKARYGRSKKDLVDSKEDFPDNNANELPAVKGDVRRKGSIVLVSKSPTGETCFQVQTPSKITKTERTEEINIWLCSGAHNPERATPMRSYHGVFTDQVIFRTFLARILNIF